MSAGQEVVRRESGAAVITKVPIPRELQELGLAIAQDEESGLRVVVIPDELRQRVNIISPVSSYVQADPNWSPSISVVKLDKELHSYNVQGKAAFNKQALETLGKAAGVLYTRTARVARDELSEGELWAYRATVGFRRSDGTIDEVTRERGFNGEVERADIEDAVNTGDKTKGWAADRKEAEIRKRWLNELRFGPGKTESKAINRALRAGLQIPTSMAPAAFSKPFLVVGYNFTPDYNDPEIKRALVAIGLNAQAAIYGGRDVSEEMPQIAGGDIPAEATPRGSAEDVAEDAPVSLDERVTDAEEAETRGGDGEQAEEVLPDPQAGSAASSAPRSDEPEPELGEATSFVPPDDVIDAAGDKAVKGETTVREVVARGEAGKTWLGWALRTLPEDDPRLTAIETYLPHREAELWAELQPPAVEE